MGLELKIVQGGVTLFDLADGTNCQIEEYERSANRRAQAVNETMFLTLIGGIAALDTKINALANALEAARRWAEEQAGAEVYLHGRKQSTDAWQQSPLLGGSLDYDLDGGIFSGACEATLEISRKNYWEAVTEAQIPLKNTNTASPTTSALTVYNCNDGSGSPPSDRVNYTDIAAGAVLGDLPAPLRLEVTNNFNDAIGVSTIFAGLMTYGDPATFNPTLEGEASTVAGSNTTTSGFSGGAFRSITFGDGDTPMYQWNLSAAQVAAAGGRNFKLIARFVRAPYHSAHYTDVWFWPQLAATFALRTGGLVRPSADYARLLRDLGDIQIPPWPGGVGSPGALDLTLFGRRVSSAASSIGLDFLFLMPTDSYREYEIAGVLEYQSVLVDDGPNDRLWIQNSSGAARLANVTATGGPLTVVPGRAARIYWLHHSETGDFANIARTLSIKAYYRPRRLVL